jgi:cyclophilin family peptidyl-prolyl cis-trans isomerase
MTAAAAALGREVGALDAGGAAASWTAAVGALGSDVPDGAESVLWAIARHEPAGGAGGVAAGRRASELRCAAARALARGAWDSEVLRTCDIGDGVVGERARSMALDRGPLVHARRAAWAELTRSPHLSVREAALKMVAGHPELGDAAITVLGTALADEHPGVVAAAADVVRSHPDRFSGDVGEGALARAVRDALAKPWPPVEVETRAALIDAALAVRLVEEGRTAALAACADANATLRARAAKALASLGDTSVRCDAPPGDAPAGAAPRSAGLAATAPLDGAAPVRSGARLVLDTDAGALAVRIDAAYAPVAAARVVALARSGFYDGLVFHRVVPGFVAQFGDPDGDGYGGGGDLLRCETAPVPFGALDVGVAIAGRDTGSSQLFVTLARYPHLDGQCAWIGRAEGDWSAVTEGDVIRAVHVEP